MKSIYIFLLTFVFVQFIGRAQTVTIYRAGLALTPTYSSIKGALSASIDNDSLVLSPDRFLESNIVIDKSITIKGTSSVTSSEVIAPLKDSSSVFKLINVDYPTKVNKIVFQDFNVFGGFAQNGPTKGGGGIYAELGTSLVLKGEFEIFGCSAPSSTATFVGSPNGSAIYSEGLLEIGDNVSIHGIEAENGGGIYSTGKIILRGNAKISGGAKNNGGAIFTNGILECNDFVLISGVAENGGGIYSDNGEVYLKNFVEVDSSYASVSGAGIFLKNSYFLMEDSAKIVGNMLANSDKGSGIYSIGNNEITINGGQVIFNECYYPDSCFKGIAFYNDSASGTSSIITINNSRFFNPNFNCLTHTSEFRNLQAVSAFLSDSTWWGESDTTGLIYNAPTATVAFRSWIVCEWILNAGLPIDTAKSFPLEAHFSLYTGAPIPSKMFWMLEGYFSSDSGTFTPSIAPMNAANIVGSVYNVPTTTRGVYLNAVVDADSFKQSVYVIGLGIAPSKSLVNGISVFPNPATNYLTLRSTLLHNKPAQLTITDMLGKRVLSQELHFTQQDLTIPINLVAGNYVVNVWQDNQPIGKQKNYSTIKHKTLLIRKNQTIFIGLLFVFLKPKLSPHFYEFD